MTNPFEDDQASYLVLKNEENQRSIWPGFVEVPGGWDVEFGPDARDKCVAFVAENWTDMRPASLARQMQDDGS
jgi:MbtH protein